jgi:inner membrane protein
VEHNIQLDDIRAMPDLASSTWWRGVAKNNGCLYIYEINTSVFNISTLRPIAQVPLFSGNEYSFTKSQQRDYTLFKWFTQEYLVLAKHKPLTLADGRYTQGTNPLYTLCGIEFSVQNKHIEKLLSILLPQDCGN